MLEAAPQGTIGQSENRREARSCGQAQHRRVRARVTDEGAVRAGNRNAIPDGEFVVDPVARRSVGNASDQQHHFTVRSRRVGDRVRARRGAGLVVADHQVLPRPVADRVADGTETQLDDLGRPHDLLGHHRQDPVAWWEQQRLGIIGAEFDLDDTARRLRHAHQAVALGTLVGRERHVEHDALVDLAIDHLGLALTARSCSAIVGQRITTAFERSEHRVTRLAAHVLAGRRKPDDVLPRTHQKTGMMSSRSTSLTS